MIELTDEYLISQGFSTTIITRFFSKVAVGDSCWIWNAYISKDGYGRIGSGRKSVCVRSHIVSWKLFRGPIPAGLSVLHNCPDGDNKACVNPKHLWLGTQTDNFRDMVTKRRHQFCEKHWNSKLTKEQVREIIVRVNLGEVQRSIAKEFNVNPSTICEIVNGDKWKLISI